MLASTNDQTPAPQISVVVATRDRPELLQRLIAALNSQTLDPSEFEVVIVDDASKGDTGALLAHLRTTVAFRLRWKLRPRRGGPAAARNTGWRIAAGPLIVFTDDDCEPTPQWLEVMLATGDGEVVVQGVTTPNPADAHLSGPFSRSLEVKELGPWYPTCNIAYPLHVLQRLGGFDESFPRGEDTDLAWRTLEAGVPIVHARAAHVHHAVNEIGAVGRLRVAWGWSPAVRVFRRHPQLRAQLIYGLFWKRSHVLLLLAVAGGIGARRQPLVALLALPYARHLRARASAEQAPLTLLPYYALHDGVELAAMVRGGLNARVPIL